MIDKPLTQFQQQVYQVISEHPGISYADLGRLVGRPSNIIEVILSSFETPGILLYEENNHVSLMEV